jgi:drug/metabolite transporter (DMT)-like permease
MYAELLAVVASFCTALSSVMATRGMMDTDVDSANLILTGTQTAALTLLLLGDIPDVNIVGLIWFALAGLFTSFIGRVFTLNSYKRIGVSTGNAIIGTSPLVVTILAFLFLGEPFVPSILFGSLLVVGGIVLVNTKGGRLSLDVDSLYLPMGASLMFAIGNILRKLGTNALPHSVLGAQFSSMAGLAACVVYMGAKGNLRLNVERKAMNWLVISGIINAFAWIALTTAISLGKVSVMSAIIYSFPLFSVVLARFMLKDSESLTRNVVLGCVLIVIGVVLVSLLG